MKRLLLVLTVVVLMLSACGADDNYDSYKGGAGWPHTCPRSCYCTATCTQKDGTSYTKSWQACSCRSCGGILKGTKMTDCECSCGEDEDEGENSILHQVIIELFR